MPGLEALANPVCQSLCTGYVVALGPFLPLLASPLPALSASVMSDNEVSDKGGKEGDWEIG
jgi:hypothetical protein